MLQRGRESFRRQAWADAEAQLSAADREDPVGPEDLERLAVATYLLGRYDDSTAVTRRIYRESIQAGDVAAAARSARSRQAQAGLRANGSRPTS